MLTVRVRTSRRVRWVGSLTVTTSALDPVCGVGSPRGASWRPPRSRGVTGRARSRAICEERLVRTTSLHCATLHLDVSHEHPRLRRVCSSWGDRGRGEGPVTRVASRVVRRRGCDRHSSGGARRCVTRDLRGNLRRYGSRLVTTGVSVTRDLRPINDITTCNYKRVLIEPNDDRIV